MRIGPIRSQDFSKEGPGNDESLIEASEIRNKLTVTVCNITPTSLGS